MKYNIVDALNYILNLKVVPFEFYKKIKQVISIPDLDKNRLSVDIDQQKIYYKNDFEEEIELEFKTNTDGGYQVSANGNIIYEEGLVDSGNTTTEGKSNSLVLAKKYGNIPGTSTDSHIHGEIQKVQDGTQKSAAFAKIGILVFISILVSLAIASLILLFK